MDNIKYKILILANKVFQIKEIQLYLSELGYEICGIAFSGIEAIEKVELMHPDLILMDLNITGEMKSIEASKRIFREYHIPILYISSVNNNGKIKFYFDSEPYKILFHPLSKEELHINIEIALCRRNFESLLQKNMEKYFILLSNMQEGYLFISQDFIIKFVNTYLAEIIGYSMEEIIGKNILNFIDYTHHEIAKIIFTIQKRGVLETQELIFISKKERKIFTSLKISPIFDEKENYKGAIVCLTDVTKVKNIMEELKEARDKALEAARTKQEFLSCISHELKTPLTAIIGSSKLLLETTLNSEQKKYLDILQKSEKILLKVINQLLDFSRIRSGKLTVKRGIFNLKEILAKTEIKFQITALKKNINLHYHLDNNIPSLIIGDQIKLKKILNNLLDNAFKFTEKGEVKLFVKRLIQEETNINLGYIKTNICLIEFTICDTGIGIPEDKLPVIFESFTQVDSSNTRKYGGIGLGLTITQKFVELLGGSIKIESNLCKGCVFTVTIPFQLPVLDKISFSEKKCIKDHTYPVAPKAIKHKKHA